MLVTTFAFHNFSHSSLGSNILFQYRRVTKTVDALDENRYDGARENEIPNIFMFS